jgi:hypothetical protein
MTPDTPSDDNASAVTATLIWEGRTVRLSYRPRYIFGMDHLELRVEAGETLPVTQTGYRSRFIPPVEPAFTADDLATFVRAWLYEAARDPAWREAEASRQQLSLFN